MYTTPTILATLASIATLSSAAPATFKREEPYHFVSISVIDGGLSHNPPIASPAPCEINKLTPLGTNGVPATGLRFDGASANVDIDKVECRAYKDIYGQIPGSAPFNHKHAAEISTNEVTIGSILCYVVTDAEAAAF